MLKKKIYTTVKSLQSSPSSSNSNVPVSKKTNIISSNPSNSYIHSFFSYILSFNSYVLSNHPIDSIFKSAFSPLSTPRLEAFSSPSSTIPSVSDSGLRVILSESENLPRDLIPYSLPRDLIPYSGPLNLIPSTYSSEIVLSLGVQDLPPGITEISSSFIYSTSLGVREIIPHSYSSEIIYYSGGRDIIPEGSSFILSSSNSSSLIISTEIFRSCSRTSSPSIEKLFFILTLFVLQYRFQLDASLVDFYQSMAERYFDENDIFYDALDHFIDSYDNFGNKVKNYLGSAKDLKISLVEVSSDAIEPYRSTPHDTVEVWTSNDNSNVVNSRINWKGVILLGVSIAVMTTVLILSSSPPSDPTFLVPT